MGSNARAGSSPAPGTADNQRFRASSKRKLLLLKSWVQHRYNKEIFSDAYNEACAIRTVYESYLVTHRVNFSKDFSHSFLANHQYLECHLST